jgi:hypothetical protein
MWGKVSSSPLQPPALGAAGHSAVLVPREQTQRPRRRKLESQTTANPVLPPFLLYISITALLAGYDSIIIFLFNFLQVFIVITNMLFIFAVINININKIYFYCLMLI